MAALPFKKVFRNIRLGCINRKMLVPLAELHYQTRSFQLSASILTQTQLGFIDDKINNGKKAVRVRFAPSPTGELHLGGLRTALYNFLFAKQDNGVFILRCEDTDQVRYVPGAMDRLIDLLSWIGIKPDEGPVIGGAYGSYIQSERLELYNKWVNYLLDEGHAYKCFCSSRRLELLRKEQMMRRETFWGYDNACRHLTNEQVEKKLSSKTPFVIRFKLKEGVQSWRDLVYGEHQTELSKVEGDPVIIKSDGYPTYHLANVIDDHHMNISHVLRGVEWHTSTAKHLQLFSAFGWTPPEYAHLPLLLNEDGTKLSKRQDSLKLRHLKEQGYEPESIISLLSLAGGGIIVPHEEVDAKGVTLNKALQCFDLSHTRTESTILAIGRLPALNQSCLRRLYETEPKEMFCARINRIATERGLEPANLDKLYEHFPEYYDRISTLHDIFTSDFLFLWQRPSLHLTTFEKLKGVDASSCITVLSMTKSWLQSEPCCSSGLFGIVDEFLAEVQSKTGLKKPALFKVLRIALSGNEVGMPVKIMFQLLEAGEIVTRCDNALNLLAT